jgi:hypothetical protein
MKTKSLLNRRVQLALGAAILASLVLGAISYRSMVAEGPTTRVVTEVGSHTGCLSEDLRAQQSQGVRDVLQGSVHSDLGILLPKMALRELQNSSLPWRLPTKLPVERLPAGFSNE